MYHSSYHFVWGKIIAKLWCLESNVKLCKWNNLISNGQSCLWQARPAIITKHETQKSIWGFSDEIIAFKHWRPRIIYVICHFHATFIYTLMACFSVFSHLSVFLSCLLFGFVFIFWNTDEILFYSILCQHIYTHTYSKYMEKDFWSISHLEKCVRSK